MPLAPHLAIPYPPPVSTPQHARHTLDLYLPPSDSPAKGLIIFIHGGAWVSSSSQDDSLAALPTLLPQDYALAIPNYRLSGQKGEGELEVRHPDHVMDVRAAVEWLVGEGAGGKLGEEARGNVWLMGHSAGAHMLAHLFLDNPSVLPLPVPVREKIKGCFFSESISDIDSLVAEYPDYQDWFISRAFGPPPYLSSSPSNPKSPFSLPSSSSLPSILISHSPADHLLSPAQSLALRDRLLGLGYPAEKLRYEGDKLGKNGEDGTHDAVLMSKVFGEMVGEWVRSR